MKTLKTYILINLYSEMKKNTHYYRACLIVGLKLVHVQKQQKPGVIWRTARWMQTFNELTKCSFSGALWHSPEYKS